jgi:hypothetical protein
VLPLSSVIDISSDQFRHIIQWLYPFKAEVASPRQSGCWDTEADRLGITNFDIDYT